VQLVQSGQQRIVLPKLFSKADANIEHDVISSNVMRQSSLRVIPQFAFYFLDYVGGGRQVAPLFRPPARVHEDSGAIEGRHC
jgi:hypothetical protein